MTAYKNWQQIKTYQRELQGGPKISIDDWLCAKEEESIAREKAKANGNGSQPVPEVRYCQCDELIVNGKRLPCPPWHDCEYIAKRSELSKIAAMLTDAVVSNGKGNAWTRRFVQEMERLSAPLLRQSRNGAHEQKAV
jgi:hypothetical protein